MKNLLLTLCLFAWAIVSTAQVKNIEYSLPFDEPTGAHKKVIQLTNGNTFFFIFGKKETAITVYNKERKQIAHKEINSDDIYIDKNKLEDMSFDWLYEINGEPVLFIQTVEKKVPSLYRIRFDKENGRIIEKKRIAEQEKYGFMAGYSIKQGTIAEAEFDVIKDINSDAYILVNYEAVKYGFSTKGGSIEIQHYQIENGQHILVNKAGFNIDGYYTPTPFEFCVNSDDVFIASYAYKNDTEDEESHVLISKLSKGDTSFTNKEIEFTKDFKRTSGEISYNPESNMLQLYTKTLVKSKSPIIGSKTTSYYMVLMSYIDPGSLQVVKSMELPTEELNIAKQKLVGTDKSYTGLPKEMVLMNNNNTAVVLQEESTKTVYNKYSSTTYTYYGDVGVIILDYSGKEVNSYCVIKENGGLGGFLSYDFVHVNDKAFVIYNENYENINIKDPKNYKALAYFSESVAVYFRLKNGIAEREFLFEPNNGKTDTKFAYLDSGHFNKTTNTYAVMMVERKGRTKKARVAWVTFE